MTGQVRFLWTDLCRQHGPPTSADHMTFPGVSARLAWWLLLLQEGLGSSSFLAHPEAEKALALVTSCSCL